MRQLEAKTQNHKSLQEVKNKSSKTFAYVISYMSQFKNPQKVCITVPYFIDELVAQSV